MTSYPPPPGENPPPPPGAPGPQPYGAPAPQAYGAPAPQAYGAPAPPPAVPVQTQAVKAPGVAWLVPLAALLALIGVFTPWFKAKATLSFEGKTIHDTFGGLYSYKDGKIGLLAPILLVVLAIGVVGLLVGKTPARFAKGGAHPVASAGKAAIIVGGVSLICTVIAWFLVKSQYKFTEGGRKYGWDEYIKAAKEAGVKLELSRGPHTGYFLTIAAAVLAIVAGVLMIKAARGSTTSAAHPGYQSAGAQGYQPAGAQGYQPAGAPQGRQPSAGGYAPAPGGYPPADPPLGRHRPPPSLQK